jgi:hypothetical protein
MSKEMKMNDIIIHVYVDGSEKSKHVENFLREHKVPYVRHEEPIDYDKKLQRPYVTIGDGNGTPLGPTSNIDGIKSTIKRLALSYVDR